MSSIEVKFKKFSDLAVTPSKARDGDAGFDLTALVVTDCGTYIDVDFGIGVEIPQGYVGLLFPRSSIYKSGCVQSNCVGVIDSGYRGPISAKFYSVNEGLPSNPVIKMGKRVCQLVIVQIPEVSFREVSDLSDSDRGSGGFGSTGS